MNRGKSILLYDNWRSSASYRLRIALGLLGMPYEARVVDLLKGDHNSVDFKALNPQGFVPAMIIDDLKLTQSLAIIEYLHSTTPGSTLLPDTALGQYRTRQLSYAIAMEIHPICNASVGAHVADITGGGEAAKIAWMRHYINKGLTAFEGLLDAGPKTSFCNGETPGMADCCLIPQIYNADRWGVSTADMPNITRIAAACAPMQAFAAAHPDAVNKL